MGRNSNAGSDHTSRTKSREDEMRIYDSMSPKIRRAIGIAPYPYVLREVKAVIIEDRLNAFQAYRLIRQTALEDVADAYKDMGATGSILRDLVEEHRKEWDGA